MKYVTNGRCATPNSVLCSITSDRLVHACRRAVSHLVSNVVGLSLCLECTAHEAYISLISGADNTLYCTYLYAAVMAGEVLNLLKPTGNVMHQQV